jgi:uncharacterized protein
MERTINQSLIQWATSKRRKPLLLRGARQVGKTYAIEVLGKTHFDNHLVKIDFEKLPQLIKIFAQDLDVCRIVQELELALARPIVPGITLLFFDEIQQCPNALMSLRYFYEDMPELHVAAAGSLLEFILSEISFPVGRVQFLNMYPLGFIEYLQAIGRNDLAALLSETPKVLSETIHRLIREELYRYFIIGGMPEAVQVYLDTGSIRESQLVHHELIHAFRNDFGKYAPRANHFCLNEVLSSVAKEVGKQIKYSHLAQDFSGPTIKNAVNLLSMAQIITLIPACHPPTLPLAASAHMKTFKVACLDIGLMQALSGLRLTMQEIDKNLLSIYRGSLAEQFIAQELRLTQEEGLLYYWQRFEKSSSAEVDYLAVKDNAVIPVEVKSGPSGRLRSLHLMLNEYPQIPYAYIFLDALYQEPREEKLKYFPLYYLQGALGYHNSDS